MCTIGVCSKNVQLIDSKSVNMISVQCVEDFFQLAKDQIYHIKKKQPSEVFFLSVTAFLNTSV